MPELNLLNANPGDVVVPLADVLELLQSALNSAELQQLSIDLIARRTTFVQAGDVITAELMNQVLADIGNLQARVAELENGIPSQESPKILFVTPNDGAPIGSELQVVGTNLSLSTLSSVLLGNTPINNILSHSEKLLVFEVPPIPNIPTQGAYVNLVVTNQFGNDSISVKILRSETPTLTADVEIFIPIFPSEVIEAGSTHDFEFRIVASANLTEQYTVTTRIDGATGWSHTFANGQTSQTITIDQTQTTTTERVFDTLVTAGSTGSASVWLNITSNNFPAVVKRDSRHTLLELEEIPTGDRDLTFLDPIVTAEEPDIFEPNPRPSNGNLLLKPNGTIHFIVRVLMNVAGQCTLSGATIENNSGTAYELTLLSGNTTSPVINEGEFASFTYQLTVSGSPNLATLPQIRINATHSESNEVVEFSRAIILLNS
jgi:hypothetical protein